MKGTHHTNPLNTKSYVNRSFNACNGYLYIHSHLDGVISPIKPFLMGSGTTLFKGWCPIYKRHKLVFIALCCFDTLLAFIDSLLSIRCRLWEFEPTTGFFFSRFFFSPFSNMVKIKKNTINVNNNTNDNQHNLLNMENTRYSSSKTPFPNNGVAENQLLPVPQLNPTIVPAVRTRVVQPIIIDLVQINLIQPNILIRDMWILMV